MEADRGYRSWTRLILMGIMLAAFACDSSSECCDGCSGGDCGGCSGGGCGGGGCGGGGDPVPPPAYTYPTSAPLINQAAQIHVTQYGFDYISDNIGPIVATALDSPDGSVSFCLEPMEQDLGWPLGTIVICGASACDDGSTGCQLNATIGSASIDPVAPNRLTVNVDITNIDEMLDIRGGIDCDGHLTASSIPVSTNVYFDVDAPPGEHTHIRLPPDELVINFDNLGLGMSGGILCGIADLLMPLLQGILLDQLTGPLNDAIGPMLCTQCGGEGGWCPNGGECNGDGLCEYPGTDTCMPLDLGLQGELDLGCFLADFAPGLEAAMGYSFYAANYGIADDAPPGQGLNLGGQAGFTASEPNMCVPYVDPPSTDRVPISTVINGDNTPAGNPFMVGIGVSKSALDLAGWAAYTAGALCISIGTETVEQISTGTFSALLGSLDELTGGRNRPMYIQLRPKSPPWFELGAGTISYDSDGMAVLEEPLIVVHIDDLDLDFYAFIEDRYVRLFTLNVDLALGIGLDVTPANELQVVLGDFTSAITRIEARDAELLDNADVAMLSASLPTLLGAMVPSLAGSLAPFALPDLQGFVLELGPGSITSVDANTMLAIFANIRLADSGGGTLVMPLQTAIDRVNLQQVDIRTVEEMLALARAGEADVDLSVLTPVVTLDMETMVPGLDDEPVEYSYRIDGGFWSIWHRADPLVLRDPVLALQGAHTIEVRSRIQDRPYTASPVLATTSVVTDYVAPRITMARSGDLLSIDVYDHVAERSALDVRYRVNRGEWVELGTRESIDLAPWAGGNALVEVEAADPSGNAGSEKSSYNLDREDGPAVAGPEAGCSAVGGRGSSAAIWLALGALVGLRRRRRAPAAVAGGVAAAAALLAVGCGSDPGTNGQTDACDPPCTEEQICQDGACVDRETEGCATNDECAEDFLCVGGECVTDTGCSSNDDCPEGQDCIDGACVDALCEADADCDIECPPPQNVRCFDGECRCEVPCPEGCASGTYCCNATSECLDLPDACDDIECEPGTRPEASSDPTGNSDTCTLSPGVCDCVELPPLPIGFYGTYTDVGVSPDGSIVAASTYNSTYGDLMVGLLQPDGTFAWEFVDGVPADGTISGSVNGPRGGVNDPGDDVGNYSSIEVGADGTLHVSYFARSASEAPRSLRYARGTPSGGAGHNWTLIVVDPNDDAGQFTDLALDGVGAPIIVYMASRVVDTTANTYGSEVRVAAAASPEPAAATDWTVSDLEYTQIPLPCGGDCPGTQVCRADTGTCSRTERDSACDPACPDTQSCFATEGGPNVCAEVAPFPAYETLVEGVGHWADLEFVQDARIAVAYYDRTHGNLRMLYATQSGSAFTAEPAIIVDGEADDGTGTIVDTGDVGWYPDLAVLSGGSIVIAYSDATLGDLKVADITAGTITIVDDGSRVFDGEFSIDRVGYDPAVLEEADASGWRIAYQDATRHDLLEATFLGTWQIPEIVAGAEDPYAGAFGFYISHARSGGGRIIVSQMINQQARPKQREVVTHRR